MVKNNVKIKDSITILQEIPVIESIVSYYFTDGEYTPYYAEMAKITSIAQYFLDGVKFEEDDYIYELVMQNEDIYKCVKKFLVPSMSKAESQYYELMTRIMEQVDDIVDFKKQKMIHNTDAFAVVGEMCNIIAQSLTNLANLNVQEFTPENIKVAQTFLSEMKDGTITEETLANAVRKAADNFKLSDNEIIEKQRQRIEEQQAQLQDMDKKVQDMNQKVKNFEKYRREHMARNVKSDTKTNTTDDKK